MNTTIIINLQYEALHNWPQVAEIMPDKTHIHFLQYPHRHVFYIKLEKTVLHNDRHIEIIDFKQKVLKYLHETFNGDFGSRSCEMIGEILLKQFDCLTVEVLEDNENGAKVYIC